MRHVPASLKGWKSDRDKIEGDELYGKADDNDEAWAVPFTDIPYQKCFRVFKGYFKNVSGML